jgi:hypothetical protein
MFKLAYLCLVFTLQSVMFELDEAVTSFTQLRYSYFQSLQGVPFQDGSYA